MAADRKQTPDILGGLLGDTSKPEYHKDSKTVKQQDSKPVEKPTSKTVSQNTIKTAPAATDTLEPVKESFTEASEDKKIKATYYITIDAVEALEEGLYQLRKMSSTDARSSISKSLIVETALQIVLAGYQYFESV